jgi:hypothetical protein
VLQILFEIAEVEKVRLDETAVKGPLDQNSQLAHPEHGNGALPAVPDVAGGLRPQFSEGVAEEAPDQIPIEFSPFLWAGPSGESRHPGSLAAIQRCRLGISAASDRVHCTERPSGVAEGAIHARYRHSRRQHH